MAHPAGSHSGCPLLLSPSAPLSATALEDRATLTGACAQVDGYPRCRPAAVQGAFLARVPTRARARGREAHRRWRKGQHLGWLNVEAIELYARGRGKKVWPSSKRGPLTSSVSNSNSNGIKGIKKYSY
jgi:hypothetical protein